MKLLLSVAWTIWAISLAGLLYGLWLIATERTHSPEATRGLGFAAIFFLFLLAGAAGLALRWAAARQSIAGVAILTLVLAYPLVGLGADKLIRASKERRNTAEATPNSPLAALIAAGDADTLKKQLGNQPPPKELLVFAASRIRDYNAAPDCLRVLLEAGADPNTARMPDGSLLLHYLVRNSVAVRVLLAHGANPNTPDPLTNWPPLADAGDSPDSVRALVEAGANIETLIDGIPAVVRFTGIREWDSALYLVEKGAHLDTRDSRGLSLDYHLNDWKDSVFGDHPKGWDLLRAAIAKRRAGSAQGSKPSLNQ